MAALGERGVNGTAGAANGAAAKATVERCSVPALVECDVRIARLTEVRLRDVAVRVHDGLVEELLGALREVSANSTRKLLIIRVLVRLCVAFGGRDGEESAVGAEVIARCVRWGGIELMGAVVLDSAAESDGEPGGDAVGAAHDTFLTGCLLLATLVANGGDEACRRALKSGGLAHLAAAAARDDLASIRPQLSLAVASVAIWTDLINAVQVVETPHVVDALCNVLRSDDEQQQPRLATTPRLRHAVVDAISKLSKRHRARTALKQSGVFDLVSSTAKSSQDIMLAAKATAAARSLDGKTIDRFGFIVAAKELDDDELLSRESYEKPLLGATPPSRENAGGAAANDVDDDGDVDDADSASVDMDALVAAAAVAAPQRRRQRQGAPAPIVVDIAPTMTATSENTPRRRRNSDTLISPHAGNKSTAGGGGGGGGYGRHKPFRSFAELAAGHFAVHKDGGAARGGDLSPLTESDTEDDDGFGGGLRRGVGGGVSWGEFADAGGGADLGGGGGEAPPTTAFPASAEGGGGGVGGGAWLLDSGGSAAEHYRAGDSDNGDGARGRSSNQSSPYKRSQLASYLQLARELADEDCVGLRGGRDRRKAMRVWVKAIERERRHRHGWRRVLLPGRFERVNDEMEALTFGGVPPALRARLWPYLLGVERRSAAEEARYDWLLRQPLPSAVEVDIEKDVTRTMPSHELFWSGGAQLGLHSLRNVLRAYARVAPEVGYCQGMSSLCAFFLLNSATESDAFFMFERFMERFEYRQVFAPGLGGLLRLTEQLRVAAERALPDVMAKLGAEGVRLEMLVDKWFLSGFTHRFPPSLTYRIWDILLFQPDTEIFIRAALAVLRLSRERILASSMEDIVVWFSEDFGRDGGGVVDDVERFLRVAKSFRLSMSEIDWQRRRDHVVRALRQRSPAARLAAHAAGSGGGAPVQRAVHRGSHWPSYHSCFA